MKHHICYLILFAVLVGVLCSCQYSTVLQHKLDQMIVPGMTKEEIIEVLGKPEDTYKNEYTFVNYDGKIWICDERWVYAMDQNLTKLSLNSDPFVHQNQSYMLFIVGFKNGRTLGASVVTLSVNLF